MQAVSSGGTVLVCPATYPEQVAITQPLTLRGVQSSGKGAAIIVSPSGGLVRLPGTSTFPQIFVHNTPGPVIIDNLTIDGANNRRSCALIEGVYFFNASGIIRNVAARNQTASSATGNCNGGLALRVSASTTPSSVQIYSNTVQNYDSAGILGQSFGAAATVNIHNNYVAGPGTLTGVATHGIWLIDNATGIASQNLVINNSGTAAGGSDGILIQGTHNARITTNTLGNNTYGVRSMPDPSFDADDGNISRNTLLASGIDGIHICSGHNLVQLNTISNSIQSGIDIASVSGTCSGNNNTVIVNTVNEACAGILQAPTATGNVTTPNTFFNTVNTRTTGTSCIAP